MNRQGLVSDKRFKCDLARSVRSVEAVAAFYLARGLAVEVPETHVRPDFKVRRLYVDDGDLFVEGHRLEVRRRGFVFHSLEEYREPWNDNPLTVLVCATYQWAKWSRSKRPVRGVCLVADDLSGMVFIRSSTSPLWERVDRYNRREKAHYTALECPKNHVEYHPFTTNERPAT